MRTPGINSGPAFIRGRRLIKEIRYMHSIITTSVIDTDDGHCMVAEMFGCFMASEEQLSDGNENVQLENNHYTQPKEQN